ncbi:MAG TPA: hypothetical protein VGH03_22930 [Caulobacteraceae bacterium]|jgi:hypothetical protein
MANRYNPWPELGWKAFTLGVEAASVMTLRTLKIAAGGAPATAEAQRMVQEKLDAGLALQAKLWTGALGSTPSSMTSRTLAHYRPKVRANRRRLSKGA